MFSKLEMTSTSIYRVQVKRSSKTPNFSVLCERAECLHFVILPAEKHVWSILLNIIPVCNSESRAIFGHVSRMPVKPSGDRKGPSDKSVLLEDLVGFRFTFEYLRRVSPAIPMELPVHPHCPLPSVST